MIDAKILFGFRVLLCVIGVSFFASSKEIERIRYFQSQTLMGEMDTVVGLPSMTHDIPDTLFQVRSKDGYPISYFKKIYTGVCFDGECRMLDIVLYWNITGRYLGFELPKGEFLSKFDHEPFTDGEYERLHELLADLLSPLSMYTFNELAPKPVLEEDEMMDGITSATSKDILQYVVEGAAFTTYTIRNLIYGSIQSEVEDLTKQEMSQELAMKIMESPDVGDKIWALNQIGENMDLTPELQGVILNCIDDNNYTLAERAIHSINSKELESSTLQMLLLEKFYQTDYGLKKLILDKLKEAPRLENAVKVDLAQNLKKWEGALLVNLLDLYTIQNIFDIETCRMVSELLNSENRYISQKAFDFLTNTERRYEEIDQELERYRARQ